jgi:hypothetical protein
VVVSIAERLVERTTIWHAKVVRDLDALQDREGHEDLHADAERMSERSTALIKPLEVLLPETTLLASNRMWVDVPARLPGRRNPADAPQGVFWIERADPDQPVNLGDVRSLVAIAHEPHRPPPADERL